MQAAHIEELLSALARWLRQEVAPVLADGANCKVIINIAPTGDVRTVLEKHQAVTVSFDEHNT